VGVEIERKFLIINDSWRAHAEQGVAFEQGYLTTNNKCSVRARIEGDSANLTIKSAGLDIRRDEFVYSVPLADVRIFLDKMCSTGTIKKTRYIVYDDTNRWEIDEFHGMNSGLFVAEIELTSREQFFMKPNWVGEEVSGMAKYMNSSLVYHPFCQW